MNNIEALINRLAALEQRVLVLEANNHKKYHVPQYSPNEWPQWQAPEFNKYTITCGKVADVNQIS